MNPETFFDKFGLLADTPNGAQKLRELILQLAVQGKLVPQDPNDEPAAVLLEKIKAEKERLVKEKKIRKSKPLPPVELSEVPNDIPLNWEWTRIGEICQIVGGGTPKTNHAEYFAENGIPWLTPADLYRFEGKIIDRGRRDISELGLQKSSAQLMPKGTVLFSSRAPIGYVAIAANDVATNQGFKSFVPFFMEINEYIYYFLKSAGKEIDNNASGTTFKEVSGKIVSQILFPLPPLEEQRRIVAKVDQLMALCDELEARQQKKQETRLHLNSAALDKLLTAHEPDEFAHHWQRVCDNFDLLYDDPETVGELRKAVLQLAVQGKLVRQDEDDEPAAVLLEKIKVEKERLVKEGNIKKSKPLPPIKSEDIQYKAPDGWMWVRLRDLGEFCGGGTPSKDKSEYWDGEIPWISPKDMKENLITKSGLTITAEGLKQTRLRLIPVNSILIVARSGILKRLLPVSLNEIECTVNQDMKVIIPYLSITSGYLRLMLKGHEDFILKNLVKGGMTVQSLKYTEFELQPFPLPPLQEQRRIVGRVDQLMTLCDELEAKVKQLRTDGAKLMGAVVAQLSGA